MVAHTESRRLVLQQVGFAAELQEIKNASEQPCLSQAELRVWRGGREECADQETVCSLFSVAKTYFLLVKVNSCFALTLCTNTSSTHSWFYKVTAVSKETDSGQRGVVLRGDWQSHP